MELTRNLLSRVLISIVCLSVGVSFFLYAKKTTLFCSRLNLDIECHLTRSGLTGSEIIPIDGLKGARIKTLERTKIKKNDRGEKIEETTTTYKIILVTDEREIPFTHDSDSFYFSKHKLVENITYFLENQEEQKLQVEQDNRWSWYLGGTIFTLAGTLVIFSNSFLNQE